LLHSYKNYPQFGGDDMVLEYKVNGSGKMIFCHHFHYRQILGEFAQALHILLQSA